MPKRSHDWYKLQKDYGSLKNIPQDEQVHETLSLKNWKINFTHCHYALRQMFSHSDNHTENFDFAIITNIELSKLPLNKFVSLAKRMYDKSRHGIYVSALSYFINPDKHDPLLSGTYSENIKKVFAELYSFSDTIDDKSDVYDFPLQTSWIDGRLLEGANYIFVHPNIRHYLWKKNAK